MSGIGYLVGIICCAGVALSHTFNGRSLAAGVWLVAALLFLISQQMSER